MRNTILALLGALVSISAAAHTQLQSTVPADGASLNTPPEELVLVFSEPVTLTAAAVRMAHGGEHEIDPLPGDAAERFTVAAPELAPGQYRVIWRALSADTHVINGEFTFTIEAGALR